MKMQVHFWETIQVDLDSHLASSSSSSQFSASLMDCAALDELFPLAQGEAVQALHHYLLLQGSSGLLEVKVPRQSEESVEMAAAETAHAPPLEDEMDCFCRLPAGPPRLVVRRQRWIYCTVWRDTWRCRWHGMMNRSF